jgi:hypothetical protein
MSLIGTKSSAYVGRSAKDILNVVTHIWVNERWRYLLQHSWLLPTMSVSVVNRHVIFWKTNVLPFLWRWTKRSKRYLFVSRVEFFSHGPLIHWSHHVCVYVEMYLETDISSSKGWKGFDFLCLASCACRDRHYIALFFSSRKGCRLLRFARWYIFKPKFSIWVTWTCW